MSKKSFYYLIKIQFLGYRFHGWQKQTKHKTVHLMIDKTLNFILKKKVFKTLGSGRTDAMVSANETAFELFIEDYQIKNLDDFLENFNFNLPQDIRALSIKEVDPVFNIIKDVKEKEYHYVFACGSKFHPFCAPLLTTIRETLNIKLMRKGATLFQGKHNFKTYCYKPRKEGTFERELSCCKIIDNTIYQANFFPEKSYFLKVIGKGFGRHQIRLMMGALIKLGKGEIDLDYISQSLSKNNSLKMDYIAPASGLILHQIKFRGI